MSRNLLDQETSPYLLLHKDNPVHWRAWGPQALAEAEASGKPILLSVGYTACHWCHVMNHESFADPETAALMNALFVNIKVDREERPDIDQVYQTAGAALGQMGGWPLTIFLTPKREPFFAGTYFPKVSQQGQPDFKTVLREVSRIYREQPDLVANSTTRVSEAFNRLWNTDLNTTRFESTLLDMAAIRVGQRFDMFYGGITGAPKFPSLGLVELLWRAFLRSGAPQFEQLVYTTLDNMCMGSLYDHIGGGFARYSVDERWTVPHFEKMLYDNAQFIDTLTMVWQFNRLDFYRERVEETVSWVFNEMMVEQAFASSLDADSEGEEGKYYLWSESEIDVALTGTFKQKFKEVYNITREGNYKDGLNILHRIGPNSAEAMSDPDRALLKRQRELLLAARQKREAPLRDDKVLADWNGMMIAALAASGAVFRKPSWTTAAVRAFDFVVKALGDGDRLYHSWRKGERKFAGYADDYAHMARAALALWEATGDRNYLNYAQRWTYTLNEHFWDVQNSGYFFSADDGDASVARSRAVFDQNTPCGNGVMVTVLAKLYYATMDNAYRERANALVQAFSGEVQRAFISMGSYLNGLEVVMAGLQIIIIGPLTSPKTHELAGAVIGRCVPNKTLMVVDPGEVLPAGHPAFGKTMQNGQPTAYICIHQTCLAPITNPVQLSQALQLPIRRVSAQAPTLQTQQPAGRA